MSDSEPRRAPRSARLRVAVLFSGALVWPNVEQTWKTWHDRLVAPHRAAVFVYASADQVRLPTDEPLPEQRTTSRDTTPKLVQRLGGTQANASTICGHVAALMGDFLVRCKVGKGLVDGASAPNPLVLQYSKLCLADRLRRAFEHDFVVRARLDMFLWQAVAMPMPTHAHMHVHHRALGRTSRSDAVRPPSDRRPSTVRLPQPTCWKQPQHW